MSLTVIPCGELAQKGTISSQRSGKASLNGSDATGFTETGTNKTTTTSADASGSTNANGTVTNAGMDAISCQITLSAAQIIRGQSLTATLKATGDVKDVEINGQKAEGSEASITFAPDAAGDIKGSATHKNGSKVACRPV